MGQRRKGSGDEGRRCSQIVPYLLIFFAALFFVAAWQNRVSYLTSGLAQDLPPFGKFAIAMAVLWAIGLVPKMRGISVGLITLVVVAIVLTHSEQFWQNLTSIGSGASALPQQEPVSGTVQAGSANSGGDGAAGSLLSGLNGLASIGGFL